MPVERTRLGIRFDTGLEHVSEIGAPAPTIDLKPGGLLRQERGLGNHLEDLFGAMKMDSFLYDSVKPDTTNTTRTGRVGLKESLERIVAIIPVLRERNLLTEEDAATLSSMIREDIFNQELLAACRRALLGG
jgi:hypothetical protein